MEAVFLRVHTTDQNILTDLIDRQMYWMSSPSGYEVKIERASMDGSARQDVFDGVVHVYQPTGLCLDAATRTLYWSEKYTNDIFYVDLNHPNTHYQIRTPLHEPYRLAILGQRIYWTDRGYGVSSMNMTTQTDIKVMFTNVRKPKAIFAYDNDNSISG